MPYQKISLDELMPPLVPVRRVADDDQMRELVMSIAREGLLHPLVVVPEDGRFRILAGHRRFIAVRSLNWDEVDCNVLDIAEDRQASITITENLTREDVNEIDLGWFLRHLVDEEGFTQAEVGERLGHSQAWVSRRLRLTRLPDHVQAAIQQRRLPWRAAIELEKIQDDEVREVYTKEAIVSGASHADVRRYVNAYKKHEATIDQAVHIANDVREQQSEEVHPLLCDWCGAEASKVPGDYVWLCAHCLRALVESKNKEVAEGS